VTASGYLLDTNVVSEIRKGDAGSQHVQRWLASVGGERFFVSVLTLGEIRRGIERIRSRGDGDQAHRLDAWLVRLEALYMGAVLPIDARVADLWGRFQVPDPLPVVDSLLAATALVHGMTLVTRNVSDVRRTGVTCVNPFEGSP
jgi:predicted nucleic acid-binding protein